MKNVIIVYEFKNAKFDAIINGFIHLEYLPMLPLKIGALSRNSPPGRIYVTH
jgi:hypothetical protein